jgi:beta-mannosidase
MRRNPILLVYIFALLLVLNVSAQDYNIFDLNGNWKFRKAGTKEWLPAKVPGVVHTDLLRNKLIPDPYDSDNEASLQWIGETGWEYMKTFQYAEEKFAWRHIDLVCKGLDTYANVYLNDSLILVADNMFREWYVDIKRFLHIGPNTLRIQFPAVQETVAREYAKLPNKLPGDERVVARKAAYHFGWDWGPKFLTSGVWRSIYIREWQSVNFLGIQFIQKNLTDSIANMVAQVTMFAELDDPAEIRLFIDTTEILRQPISLVQGPNVVRGEFAIPRPKKWWPFGSGDQFLYNFGYEVRFNGQIIAKGRQRIGLRTIELVQEPDSLGKSFYFLVNGKPVFAKGANYIPQDNFLPRVKDSAYRELIRDVRAANMNMLRVWGGGIYEDDLFYDLCDENGIMVWQDFMFACAMYPGSKEFFDNIRNEAIQNVVRLRKHPSIAVWCGNNEIDEGWKNWGWQKQYGYNAEDSARIYRDYRMIFTSILPNVVRKFDTARAYIATSPLHGWGRPESLTEGDSHYWGVWWGKQPFTAYNEKVGRFMSEYGFQGFPDISTIRRFTKPADRVLGSPVMKAHQKHPTGFELIDDQLLREYRKPRDFESYVYVSQLLQARGIIGAIEAHRRHQPYCMGTLFWQLNDCWPGISWSARDKFGKKKALFHALPQAYDLLLLSPVVEDGRIKVFLSNDDWRAHGGVFTVKLIDFDGNLYSDEGFRIEAPGNSSYVYYDTLQNALLGDLDPAKVFLLVTYRGHMSGVDAKNLYYFVSPKDLKLPAPKIEKSLTPSQMGYTLTISSETLVKNVWLSSNTEGQFTQNYFDLLPNEKKRIEFITKVRDPKMLEKIMIKSLVDSY